MFSQIVINIVVRFAYSDIAFRVFYFVTVNGRLLDARVDKCLTRQDYTDALSNVPATGTDQNYDEFVYSKNNADKLMEYE